MLPLSVLTEERNLWQRRPIFSGELKWLRGDGDYGGLILVGTCDRSAIVAYFGRRDEDEIVIDPKRVMVADRRILESAE